jgi:hypothetical protein
MLGAAESAGASFEAIKQRVRAVAEVSAWPQMLQLMERVAHRESLSVWDYPSAACVAVGGEAADALPGAAAVFCSLISIHLVDDMLDDDPKGDYHRLGAGRAANLGLAFQAAGHLVLDDPGVHPRVLAALHAAFARMSIGTAFGQDMDSRELRNEEEYWRTVGTKTSAARRSPRSRHSTPSAACWAGSSRSATICRMPWRPRPKPIGAAGRTTSPSSTP